MPSSGQFCAPVLPVLLCSAPYFVCVVTRWCRCKHLCQSSADEKYISTSAYKAQGGDEIGYEKGAVLRVMEKKLDGWWRVQYQGREGWTPGIYLQRMVVRRRRTVVAAAVLA